jgi:hypothetical protein
MNDYFFKILIRERHEEILAEFRATQLSQLGHARVTTTDFVHFILHAMAPWFSNRPE